MHKGACALCDLKRWWVGDAFPTITFIGILSEYYEMHLVYNYKWHWKWTF